MKAALQQFCVKENLGVISYYALAAGFLSGKYRKAVGPRRQAARGMCWRISSIRAASIFSHEMDKIAERHQATLAQIAIAWVLAQPGITAPIVSATNLAQLDEILGATEIALDATALTGSTGERVKAAKNLS